MAEIAVDPAIDQLAIDIYGCRFSKLEPIRREFVLEIFNAARIPTSRTNAKRNWWMRILLDRLEALTGPERAARGRSYYRQGRVSKKLTIENFGASGRVRGSSRTSYHVTLWSPEQLASASESLAASIAANPTFYLDFREGRLSEGLANVRALDGSLIFGPFFEFTADCDCYDYSECKHTVALANCIADVFEKDFVSAMVFFGIDIESFSRRIAELRTVDDDGDGVTFSTTDSFGWPLPDKSKKISSTRRFWTQWTPSTATGYDTDAYLAPLDAMAHLPKNRIRGANGSMHDQLSAIYRAIDASDENGEI